jgi:hypothetical protein
MFTAAAFAVCVLAAPQWATAGTQLWDFEDGADGWNAPNGDWEVSDGEYHEVSGAEPAMHSVVGEDDWDNYVIEAKVRIDQGDWAGIAFRVQSDFEYYIYYMNAPDNKSELWQHNDGGFDSRNNLADIPGVNILIEREEFHEMQIVVEGDTFQLWIDDELQSEDVNGTYSTGKIGVWAWSTQASFDDVMVTGDNIKDTLAVESAGRLATVWGRMKGER